MPARLSRSTDQVNASIATGLLKGVLAWGMVATQNARLKAPVKTGRLAREIKASEPYMKAPLVAAIKVGVSGLAYARAVEFGSGIHAEGGSQGYIHIVAGAYTGKSSKKALAFVWERVRGDIAYGPESNKVFFRSVMHPGVMPRPYLRPGVESSKEQGRRLIMDAVAAELRR